MRTTSIGVILSGAGSLDGAEIQESVLVLLALSRHGSTVKIYAPDMRFAEINHVTRLASGVERNARIEAARIARSDVNDLAHAQGTDHEGWILPGGQGAAKNLSDFASKGASGSVNRELSRVIREAFAARIPVGACGVAPAVLALIGKASSTKLKLTIGNDQETARLLSSMGHVHIDAAVTATVVDTERKVVTTPAYMYEHVGLSDVQVGIDKLVDQVVAWSQDELSAPRPSPR